MNACKSSLIVSVLSVQCDSYNSVTKVAPPHHYPFELIITTDKPM